MTRYVVARGAARTEWCSCSTVVANFELVQWPTSQSQPAIQSGVQGFGANSADILLKTAMISGLLAYLVIFIWSLVTSTMACNEVADSRMISPHSFAIACSKLILVHICSANCAHRLYFWLAECLSQLWFGHDFLQHLCTHDESRP